jgi:ABC-2 type transport system permease protein
MLWYQSWLETRSRFLIGFALLAALAAGTVFEYPAVLKLMPLARSIDTTGPLGRMVAEAVELQREYRGFVWWQWFRQNLAQIWTLCAILLGAGGLLSRTSGRAALFTLSLPISRTRLIAVRTTTALAELFVLALIPSLLIPLLSPAVGESYALRDVVVHGVCLFVAGAVFFSLSVLLSTVFTDLWRPLLIACVAAVGVAVAEQFARTLAPYGVFSAMTAERYFREGGLPWPGLILSASASAALLYGASVNLARRDF